MADDEIGASVDDRMGEGAQVTTVLAVEGLATVGHVQCLATFGTAVEADDDEVGLGGEGADQLDRGLVVVDVVAGAAGVKGHHGELEAVGLPSGDVAHAAGVVDGLLVEEALGLGATDLAEVAGVVVGGAHHVEACGLVDGGVAAGRAEGVAAAGGCVGLALGRLTHIAERSLEVAEGHVCVLQPFVDVVEGLPGIWRQVSGRKVGADHHVANGPQADGGASRHLALEGGDRAGAPLQEQGFEAEVVAGLAEVLRHALTARLVLGQQLPVTDDAGPVSAQPRGPAGLPLAVRPGLGARFLGGNAALERSKSRWAVLRLEVGHAFLVRGICQRKTQGREQSEHGVLRMVRARSPPAGRRVPQARRSAGDLSRHNGPFGPSRGAAERAPTG